MTARQGPTLRRRQLGAILRGLREDRGLTAAEAADSIRGSESKISRIENGRSGTRQRDLTDLLNLYRVGEDDPLRARLAELARETREAGWWRQSYGEAVPDWFEDYLGLEGEASSISTYQSALVEGLLQTPAYAEALHRDTQPAARSEQIRRWVQLRLDRQRVLCAENPPRLCVVLDEAVLRRPVGGPEVHREQLRHLIASSALPHIALRVLPFAVGGYASLGFSFTILGFPEDNPTPVAYIEQTWSSLYVEREANVKHYRETFNHLLATALPMGESIEMIKRIAEE